jgi:ketosteroid isomerase-like protein
MLATSGIGASPQGTHVWGLRLASYLVVSLLAPCAWPVPARAAGADAGKIQALMQERVRAFSAGDVAGQMRLYAAVKDMFVFNVVPPSQADRAALEADLIATYRMFNAPPSLAMTDLHVTTGSGDIGFATALLHMTGKRKDGKLSDLWLRMTSVVQKRQGRWQIVHEHLSVPVNTESAQAFLSLPPAKQR